MYEEQKKKWPKHLALFLVTILFAIPVVYVGFQVYLAINRTYRTETAIAYTMTDSLQLSGVAAFDSVEVPGTGGKFGYLVDDGERVAAGTVIAEIYTDPEQGLLREQLERCERKIDLLTRSESASGSDIAQLNVQSRQALYDYLDSLDDKAYEEAIMAADEFLLAQNRFQVRTGKLGDFSTSLAALDQQRQSLLDQLSRLSTITAQTNGYFVSREASAGISVDRTLLDGMSPSQLKNWLGSAIPTIDKSAAGQVMGGFSWWFYAFCDAEQTQRLSELDTVQISVPGKQDTPITAKVTSLEQDENGECKLVLECENINEEVLRLGRETARIDLQVYEGIRVNRDALHIVDGERGVYVNYGGIQRFRRIETLYENEDYILVPPDGEVGTDNEVRLYDEIIVEGNNLRDNKLV